jgi:glycosyltransferase involved in cell wall biosynthesis
MRIIQVIDTLNIGGAEKMCIQLANLLYEKGHAVSILYFYKTKINLLDQVHKDIPIHFIAIKENWYNPLYFYKILRLIQQFDIAHVHMRSSLRIIYLATFFGKLFKKVVFHDHTGGSEQFEQSSRGVFIPQAMRAFNYVAVYNELAQKSISKFNLDSKSSKVISNFVTKPQNNNIEIFPFDNTNLEILFVGNFREQKNLIFLIYLCEELQMYPKAKFRFHIIGAINDYKYFEKFIELVYSKSLKAHFIIHNELSSVFNFTGKVNLALMPSIEESGPLVLIEYLILNLPFLAHNVGDITNKIATFLPNQVMDNLNPSTWAKNIHSIDFQKDIKDYQRIYSSEFNEEVAYQKWIEVYKEIQSK